MLKTDPASLWIELHEAEDHRDKYLGEKFNEERKRYAGVGYRSDWNQEEPDLENFAHQWFSLYASMLLSGSPVVRLTTTRVGSHQDIVKALELALNKSIEDSDFRGLNELLFYDWGLRWAVALTTPEAVPGFAGHEDVPYRPTTQRLSPAAYVSDPLSINADKDRYRAHLTIRDRDDVVAESEDHPERGWNASLATDLSEGAGVREGRPWKDELGLERGEVGYWEVWIPEHRLDKAKDANGEEFTPREEDGYHGTIFTVAHGGLVDPTSAKKTAPYEYLREPRPWWGPREGPYTVGGAYLVQDEPYPLSPIQAVRGQTDELNAHRAALSRAAAAYKRGIAAGGMSDDDLAVAMRNFEDLDVFKVESADDLRGNVMQIELGGMTEQHLAHHAFLKESVRENSGLSEAESGGSSRDVTATAAAIANSASLKRQGYLAGKFIRFNEAVLKKEAWFLIHDDRMKQTFAPPGSMVFVDEETGEPIEEPVKVAEWRGGLDDGEVFPDFDIRIEVMSMAHTTEEREAMIEMEIQAMVANELPLMPLVPYFDWEWYYRRKGERLRMPDLPEHIDVQGAMQLGALQLAAQLQGGGGQKEPQPRLSADQGPKTVTMGGAGPSMAGNARLGQSSAAPQPSGGPAVKEVAGAQSA